MTRRPEDVTLSATMSCVMVATAAAVVLIVYTLLMFVGLVPSSFSTQDVVRLFN